MGDDLGSALEELDIRRIERDLAKLLDAGSNVLSSLVASALGLLDRGTVLAEQDRGDAEEAAQEWAYEEGFDLFSG